MQELIKKIADLEKQVERLSSWENNAGYGTAFPTNNLYNGRTFFRTDRAILYEYTGITNALWQTVQTYPLQLICRTAQPFTTSSTSAARLGNYIQYGGAYIESLSVSVFQTASPINTTNFVSWNLVKVDSSGVQTGNLLGGTDPNNQGQTAGQYYSPADGIASMTAANRILDNTMRVMAMAYTIHGATGNVFFDATLNLRGIG